MKARIATPSRCCLPVITACFSLALTMYLLHKTREGSADSTKDSNIGLVKVRVSTVLEWVLVGTVSGHAKYRNTLQNRATKSGRRTLVASCMLCFVDAGAAVA